MDRGVAGSGVVLRPNNSRAGVEAVGCSIGGRVLSSTVPGSCAGAGASVEAMARPTVATSKAKLERANTDILNAPQCFGAREPFADTQRHALGGGTLPRVGRAVQT